MKPENEGSQELSSIEGRYANVFEVGYNAFEFLIHFGQVDPANEQPQIHTRIITSPAYAKAVAEMLHDSLLQYEKMFGSIPQVQNE